MTTRSDMETELQAQLTAASNSTLYPSSRLTQLIQDAYIWATQEFIWRDLVRALKTGSEANSEYYDYPDIFRSDTIVRLEVDGEPYGRKNFEDYLDYKENNPNADLKMFANYGRYYFIHPTPTANGSNNIHIWGAQQAPALSSSTSETIFSNNKEGGNEAVVRKAFSVAIRRLDSSLSEKEEEAARSMLARLNRKEWASTHRDKRIQHPKFMVPDYFTSRNNAVSPIGQFSYSPGGFHS